MVRVEGTPQVTQHIEVNTNGGNIEKTNIGCVFNVNGNGNVVGNGNTVVNGDGNTVVNGDNNIVQQTPVEQGPAVKPETLAYLKKMKISPESSERLVAQDEYVQSHVREGSTTLAAKACAEQLKDDEKLFRKQLGANAQKYSPDAVKKLVDPLRQPATLDDLLAEDSSFRQLTPERQKAFLESGFSPSSIDQFVNAGFGNHVVYNKDTKELTLGNSNGTLLVLDASDEKFTTNAQIGVVNLFSAGKSAPIDIYIDGVNIKSMKFGYTNKDVNEDILIYPTRSSVVVGNHAKIVGDIFLNNKKTNTIRFAPKADPNRCLDNEAVTPNPPLISKFTVHVADNDERSYCCLLSGDGYRYGNPDGHTYQYNPNRNDSLLLDRSSGGVTNRKDVQIPTHGTM